MSVSGITAPLFSVSEKIKGFFMNFTSEDGDMDCHAREDVTSVARRDAGERVKAVARQDGLLIVGDHRGVRSRAFIALAVCAFGFNSGAAMAIEEPAFELIEKAEPYEIRQYRPFIVAETYVSGDLDAASNAGFRLIADYIFGNNLSVRGAAKPGEQAGEKIAMTAPVAAEPVSERIAMTAPVLAEPQAAAAGADMKATRWRIHFVMPSQYTLETLPKPVNPAVALRAVPGRRYAVVVFSGLAGAEKVQTKTDELLAWLQQRGLKARGAAQLARYNPPWTLPFFRRNEVMVELLAP